MARTWLLCSKYSAIFIFFTLSLDVFAYQDTYLYETSEDHFSNSNTQLYLKLLDSNEGLHKLHKRQIDQVAHNDTTTTLRPKIETVNKTEIIKKPVPTPKSTITLPNSLGKNLGENGTGIRKNYTSSTTVAPVILTDKPSKTDDHLIVPKVIKSNDTSGESSSDESSEISIDKFSEDPGSPVFNKTLEEHHVNTSKTDTHIYYNSTFTVDTERTEYFWVNMENNSDVRINSLLSNAYRRAATVKLSFDFPFYGHFIRNITIATGGFIYMGEYVHSWLAATQYIAPLMANFDTGLSNQSFIKYLDNGTAFTVTWEEVYLQDNRHDGAFTFQTTLYKNGDIAFVYKSVPVVVESILDDHHPVKVGLSDAYLIDRNVFFVRRKTIYEYHRVQFYKDDIRSNTVIYLKALPTCLDHKDCNTCLTTAIDNFECTWCPSTNRCSNGLDRHRQDWLAKGCDRRQITNETQCSQANILDGLNHNDEMNTYYNTDKHVEDTMPHLINPFKDVPQNNFSNNQNNDKLKTTDHKETDAFSNSVQASRISQNSRGLGVEDDVKMGASGIITILFLVATITALAVWVFYAYRNPHTTSGQMLIRYRPSQWRWKRGEARYTAATIHM